MGSKEDISSAGSKHSIRTKPLIPMFWVISTALVLHGVTIAARGPIKEAGILESLMAGTSPKSHSNFGISEGFNGTLV